MKNLLLTLFVMGLCVYSSITSAQNTVGLKGGVSLAHVTEFEGVYASSDRLSGHAGIFINHTMDKYWRVQAELLWSGQGQHHFDNAREYTLALDYLQIPVMVQYYPVSRLYVEAGPAVGILLSAKDKGEGDGSHVDLKSYYTAAELVAAVGLGVKATDAVSVYGRYNFGVTDMSRRDNNNYYSKFYNRFAQIGIAVQID